MIRFCCCEKKVCIQIGEIKIEPLTKDKKRAIKWWMIDIARDILNEIVENLDKCDLSGFKRADVVLIQKNLKKILEDLERMQDAIA